MTGSAHTPTHAPVHKKRLSKGQRLLRLVLGILDPRAWVHAFRIVNYYNFTHVTPRRQLKLDRSVNISPNVSFNNPERIEFGMRVSIGAHCYLWAGPGHGRIILSDDVLFGQEVIVTAAGYRFNDGHPVTQQASDEADVFVGRDVWVGARAIILPGARIGDGAIIGAGSVVRGTIPPMAIAVGVPARVVGSRDTGKVIAGDKA